MVINQPHDKQLGIQIIENLESSRFNQLTIMVAYAKLSGVYRLLPYIEKFHKNNGKIRFVVGIDQQNTTYDALLQLTKIADELHIFHSENITQTFHIKCYWLKGDNETWYAIGSNNLTAGGLFSNYELYSSNLVTDKEALAINSELEEIYSIYTNPASVCSHKVTDLFLQKLLDANYIVKELQQRKVLVERAKSEKLSSSKTKLFGNEFFPAPLLPEQYRKSKGKTDKIAVSHDKKEAHNIQQISSSTFGEYENNYLIRLIPRAGDRSKQVHFTTDLLEKYFCLSPGDGILVQEMYPTGEIGEIEQRQIVFSQRNHNVKIELAGAALLDTNYPANPDTRPVLILKKVNPNLFVYMILLDGDEGYTAINNRLKSLPSGRALPYEVIDENTMFSLWNECPIT